MTVLNEKDHVNLVAATCGENSLALRMGCGEPINACASVFRCTDCGVPFHVGCARRHFLETGAHASQLAEALGERDEALLAAARAASLATARLHELQEARAKIQKAILAVDRSNPEDIEHQIQCHASTLPDVARTMATELGRASLPS